MLLGALGGRLDHALANLMMVVRAARRGVWAEIRAEGVQIVRINESYTLTGAKGSTVSLLPLGEARGISVRGCYYTIEDFTLASDTSRGVEQRGHGGRSRVHGARRRPDALPLQRYSRTWGKCMNPILLDERLSAAAKLAREALTGMERPVAADIGCDHGFLTAKLLETVPNLTMLASDVSAPSLEKARRLLAARGLSGRATLAVADGLSAIDRLVDAVMILGMGAGTILKIVSEGRDKIGGAALIVQANVDLPLLRGGLAELGFAVQKEIYCRAAGRHYVTMLARAGMVEMPDERASDAGRMRGRQRRTRNNTTIWRGRGASACGRCSLRRGRTRRARKNDCLRAADLNT